MQYVCVTFYGVPRLYIVESLFPVEYKKKAKQGILRIVVHSENYIYIYLDVIYFRSFFFYIIVVRNFVGHDP